MLLLQSPPNWEIFGTQRAVGARIPSPFLLLRLWKEGKKAFQRRLLPVVILWSSSPFLEINWKYHHSLKGGDVQWANRIGKKEDH